MSIILASWMGHSKEYYFSQKLKEIGRMKADGANVINLGIGSPDLSLPKVVTQKMQRIAVLFYANTYQKYVGIEPLCQAFSSWYLKRYPFSLHPGGEIMPLMDSKKGIIHISMAYLEHGDPILIPDPVYPIYTSVYQLLEKEVLHYKLREENQWQPELDVLERRDLSRVKILWINYPCMPTSAKTNFEQLHKVVRFACKHKILLVYDNLYGFILNPHYLSLFQVEEAKDIALELNSLSKSNMAEWHTGMVAGKKEFIQNILKVKIQMDSDMYLSLQLGTIEGIGLSERWEQDLNVTYAQWKALLHTICHILGLSYDSKSAGLFLWAKLPYDQDDKLWSDRMLYGRHIFITPGRLFGSCGRGHVRLPFVLLYRDFGKTAKTNGFMKIRIIGLGLVGGSMALSIRQRAPGKKIFGTDQNPSNASHALELGMFDEIAPLDVLILRSSLIMAMLVDKIRRLPPELLNKISDKSVLLGTGSTKEEIFRVVADYPRRERFVTTHPIAGREYSGPKAAFTGLFKGKMTLICQTDHSVPEAIQKVEAMYTHLGISLIRMDVETHDLLLAYISHLSHIFSFGLVRTVLDMKKNEQNIFHLTGSGFSSTVHLAKSYSETWLPIFRSDKSNLFVVTKAYMDQLRNFYTFLEEDKLGGIC